jgi:hypothetical protein
MVEALRIFRSFCPPLVRAFKSQSIDRVLGFCLQSSELGLHHPQASVSPFGLGERDTLVAGEEVGGPNADEGTDTVVL